MIGDDARKGPARTAWRLEDIAYDAIDCSRVRDDRELLYLLASASFVEITSDLYTENLLGYFADDPAVLTWLREEWEPEELQHGAALRRYVETVWPAFDWVGAYSAFQEEYKIGVAAPAFPSARALELAGRCVVETGTASFYRMLADSSPEPVLAGIADRISRDEIRHYKGFYEYFLRYAAAETPGRAAVIASLWRKARDIGARNAYLAFKHSFLADNRARGFLESDYRSFRDGVSRRARRHYPHRMAVRMLLRPLGLGKRGDRILNPLAEFAARRLIG